VSAAASEPADRVGSVVVDCPACELPFDPVGDRSEAQHLAGVHNDLHHGGRDAAGIVSEPDGSGRSVVSGLGWLVAPQVCATAEAQAFAFTGEKTAAELAWSARVDAAVQGMDVLDPAGLDEWMATHAESSVPHLAEAGLVAAWETHIRDLYGTANAAGEVTALTQADLDTGHPDTAQAVTGAAEQAAVRVVEVSGDVDDDGWP
jgi:hypothetical protein